MPKTKKYVNMILKFADILRNPGFGMATAADELKAWVTESRMELLPLDVRHGAFFPRHVAALHDSTPLLPGGDQTQSEEFREALPSELATYSHCRLPRKSYPAFTKPSSTAASTITWLTPGLGRDAEGPKPTLNLARGQLFAALGLYTLRVSQLQLQPGANREVGTEAAVKDPILSTIPPSCTTAESETETGASCKKTAAATKTPDDL